MKSKTRPYYIIIIQNQKQQTLHVA